MALPYLDPFVSLFLTVDGYDINSPSIEQNQIVEMEDSPKDIPSDVTPIVNPTRVYRAPDGNEFDNEDNFLAYMQTLERLNVVTTADTKDRQSAYETLAARFQQSGLGDLAKEIEKILKGEGKTRAGASIPIPTSDSGFYLALIETEAYYGRFGVVNALRVKNGWTALDERTILAMEDEYQKTLKNYNMPAGFYDTPEDFVTFLSNNLSEVELADRLQAYRQFVGLVDPNIKSQLKNLYNIDENMLTAYVADPDKGQQLLNSLAGKSMSAAAALLSGLTQDAVGVAMGFGAGNMSFLEQQRRFGAAQPIAERGKFLSQIGKEEKEFGEKEAVEITFGGLEQSVRAAEKLASKERARFSGRAGTTTTSLSTPTAGQI
jgi:hypothetical protein